MAQGSILQSTRQFPIINLSAALTIVPSPLISTGFCQPSISVLSGIVRQRIPDIAR